MTRSRQGDGNACVVAVDARPLERVGSGISRFLFETLTELARRPELKMVLFSNRPLHPANALPLETVIDTAWRRVPGSVWMMARLNRLALRHRARIVWGTMHVLPLRRRPLRAVLTMHDLVYRIMPETMGWWNRAVLSALTDGSIARADFVFADSHATRDDMLRLVGSDPARSAVAHLARRAPAAEDGIVAANDGDPEAGLPDEPYLFALGSIEPRKNIAGLLDCFERLAARRPALRLRLAGAHSWKSSEVMARIGGVACDRVRMLGFLGDDEVRRQISGARALVMASHLEGFGLPVVEAAGLAPIVLSDIPVFRELAQWIEGICFVDFADRETAAAQIDAFLASNPPPARFAPGAEAHFSWNRVADDYAEAFGRLCSCAE